MTPVHAMSEEGYLEEEAEVESGEEGTSDESEDEKLKGRSSCIMYLSLLYLSNFRGMAW